MQVKNIFKTLKYLTFLNLKIFLVILTTKLIMLFWPLDGEQQHMECLIGLSKILGVKVLGIKDLSKLGEV